MRVAAARLLPGLLIAGTFLWLALRHIDLQQVLAALALARPGLLALGVCFFAAGYACRIQRWRLLLQPANPSVTWRACAGPLLAGFAVNNVLPLRAGDVMRTIAFQRELGAGASSVVASLVSERVLDALMLLLILGCTLLWMGAGVPVLGGISAAGAFAGSFVLLVFLFVPRLLAGPLRRLTGRFAQPSGWAGKLAGFLDKVMSALSATADHRRMAHLVAWSAAAWSAEGALFWLVALGMPALPDPSAAVLAFSVGTLSTLIPGTPGYVGTFDFFVSQAMVLRGNPQAASVAYALLVHALLWAPPTLAGGLFLAARSLRRKQDQP